VNKKNSFLSYLAKIMDNMKTRAENRATPSTSFSLNAHCSAFQHWTIPKTLEQLYNEVFNIIQSR
jgi:hypothetical protein